MTSTFLRRATVACLVLLALSSCYVPDNYEAEIRFSRAGAYGLGFEGELTWAPLYGQSVRGDLTAEEIATQQQGFLEELRNTRGVQRVTSLGRGQFDVVYDRTGVLTKTAHLVFVKRNAAIFELRADSDGTVRITGAGASSSQADQLEALPLTSRGLFRVVTDARVLDHNAQRVSPGGRGFTRYDWQLNGFRGQRPRLTLTLERELPTS